MSNSQPPEESQSADQISVKDKNSIDQIASKSADTEVASLQTSIASMLQGFDFIARAISQLQADFDTKIKYDESKERTIDALHRELQDYREDLNFKILRPLILDLTRLYDDLNQLVMNYSKPEQPLEDRIVSDLQTFVEEIEQIVSRYGFELYQVDTEIFDRSLQKVQKVEKTEQPDLDKQVIERVRPGLRYGDRVVRPEEVIAYRYVAASDNIATSPVL